MINADALLYLQDHGVFNLNQVLTMHACKGGPTPTAGINKVCKPPGRSDQLYSMKKLARKGLLELGRLKGCGRAKHVAHTTPAGLDLLRRIPLEEGYVVNPPAWIVLRDKGMMSLRNLVIMQKIHEGYNTVGVLGAELNGVAKCSVVSTCNFLKSMGLVHLEGKTKSGASTHHLTPDGLAVLKLLTKKEHAKEDCSGSDQGSQLTTN